tara:strand:- start:1296 stop:1895 length:600 start_codon:yes stop_codon:yes gene_type:complete
MSSIFETQFVSKPIPVFSTIIEDHVELNRYLKEVILEHRQNNPESTNSNVKAWHSSWVTHQENPKFQPVALTFLAAVNFISEGYYNCDRILTKYEVANFWCMMYEDTEWTKRHCHYPSDFAVCYYVDVDPGCAPIIFESVVDDEVNRNNKPLTIQPQNGMLLIWPAELQHEVPPTKGKRMCISMNVTKGDAIKTVMEGV